MINFMTSCFDLLFNLIAASDNIIILLPFCAIVVSLLISLTFNLIRGKFK